MDAPHKGASEDDKVAHDKEHESIRTRLDALEASAGTDPVDDELTAFDDETPDEPDEKPAKKSRKR